MLIVGETVGDKGRMEFSVLPVQFCCKPKTA